MPAERTLPTAAAHREFTVEVEGQALPREHHLLAASISHRANHIGSARLVFADGAAASGEFPLSAGDLLVPGARLVVKAGSGPDDAPLFSGRVVSQRLKLREGGAAQLIVECRHGALALAAQPRSAAWFDSSDADVFAALLGELAGELAATPVQHEQIIQHDTSDWDFVVTRAQALGLLVLTRDGLIETRAPTSAGPSVATLQFGATLLEFDAETGARSQSPAATVRTWNADDQAVSSHEGATPRFTPPGNFDADALGDALGLAERDLPHLALGEEEAAALAGAWRTQARAGFLTGRAKCEGFAPVQPGDVVTLAGLGARFNGAALCTGVRHDLDTTQGWKTHLQFGEVAPDPARLQRLAQPRATQLLAPMPGLQIGIVTDNEDPSGRFRVRVRLPLVPGAEEGLWARVASLDAGPERGFFFRPEIGDEVVLGFFDADPRAPVLLGMLHSSAKAAPLAPSNDNHEKGFTSRSGMRWHLDDDKKVLTFSTPAGHALVLSENDGSVVLKDQHGNRITLDAQGITLDSRSAMALKAATNLQLEAGATFGLKGLQTTIEGSALAELKSGGVAKLSGSMVHIN